MPYRIPQGNSGLSSSMQFIKGVGPRRASLFSRMGVETVLDALYFFPRRYEDRRSIKKINQISVGTKETVLGEVVSHRVKYTPRGRGRLYEVSITDGTGSITGLWFNFREPYMKQRFSSGKEFLFHGEVRWDGHKLVIYHPEVEELRTEVGASLHFGRIVPVYPLTEELGQRRMRTILHEVVTRYAISVVDDLPAYLREKYHLPAITDSLSNIHFPPDEMDINKLNEKRSPWHKRIIFEEFFFLQLWLMAKRSEREKTRRSKRLKDRKTFLDAFIGNLPFRLTQAQGEAFKDIKKDMLSDRPMYRLLQGDVGCGKTAVTAMALLLSADNGFQSAVMAPTEILARQHQETLSKLFKGLPVEVNLLVSGLSSQEKDSVRRRVSEGTSTVTVGTHALIQEQVVFANLGLVVIDEQHRFGVGHRLSLKEKGNATDMLIITATPIPRSLAMTLYGDMDISIIGEMPPGRQPVETRIIEERSRESMYRLVRKELDLGHQAFVIYPLVEESERLELRAAKNMAAYLQEEIFIDQSVGIVHGRMKTGQKAETMEAFKKGKIQILVSTTVVEVGVDIPRATVMVVEHAERFGLAQLHQLRGRVGRGGQRALCLLVVSEGAGEDARRRMEILAHTSDGFKLAEEDLMERGPGELAGLKQSGAPDFLLANLIRHRKALEYAREEALAAVRMVSPGKYELTKLLDLARIRWSTKAEYLLSG